MPNLTKYQSRALANCEARHLLAHQVDTLLKKYHASDFSGLSEGQATLLIQDIMRSHGLHFKRGSYKKKVR